MDKDTAVIISVIISFGSLLVSSIAVYISWANAQKQGELTQRLNSQDQDFERKKFIAVLWDKIAEVPEIKKDENDEYNATDVWYALNTLELIAICWINNIIDRRMIFLIFGNNFRSRVGEIESIINPLKHLRKTGLELLHERQVILNVKREIEEMFYKEL